MSTIEQMIIENVKYIKDKEVLEQMKSLQQGNRGHDLHPASKMIIDAIGNRIKELDNIPR